VDSQVALRRAVEAWLDTRDHPVMDERDSAADEVELMLQQVVREHLSDGWEFDPRHVTLDGMKTMPFETDGVSNVDIVGAFYLLDGTRHRMLPIEARLSVQPGSESSVMLAGPESTFAMSTNERQFARALQSVRWVYRLSLHLA
jgi:hypothetical protein